MTESNEPRAAKLREVLRYDPETGKLFWLPRQHTMFSNTSRSGAVALCKTWNGKYAGREALTSTNRNGYLRGTVFSKSHRAHQVAWAIYYGEWPQQTIDHINGDPADNRISNLRCVSVAENARNQRVRVTNSSGATGVRPSRWAQRWEASIRHNYRDIYLGTFDTKEDAIAARKTAEAELGFHPNHGRAT